MMELQKASSDRNRILSPVRRVEDAIVNRIAKYLYRQVQKPNPSHFCLFLLFLLVARHGQAV